MFEDFTLTSYASASRLTNGQLERQAHIILKNNQLITFVESVSQMVLILNTHRQIIYANKSFLQFCKSSNLKSLIGQRPGESLNCENAFKTPGGCGTSELCKSCGGTKALLESIKGVKSTHECKILTRNSGAVDLRVTATPFNADGEKLTILSISDISHEKRRISLERVFIHDILNSAGAIAGLSSILKEIDDKEEMTEIASTIENAANNLIEEIKIQREFAVAERGELVPDLKETESIKILEELACIYSNHDVNPGKKILVHPASEKMCLKTDHVLLKRILGNMIKNALEAYQPNDEINLKCISAGQSIRFSVHNKSVIKKQIQLELFKRFYSTKGNGRGIGTYSMKLLGEKYLNGKVWFESSPTKGTTFFIEL